MAEDERDDRSALEKAVDSVKHAVERGELERGLMNQAAAMPAAAGDLGYAPESPAATAGIPPGAGAAAAGSLSDEEPVGRADDTPADESTQ